MGNKYVGPWDRESRKDLFSTLKWLAFGEEESRDVKALFSHIPDTRELITSAGVHHGELRDTERNHVTWVGHATCALQVDGVRILTDPMFSDYASAVQGLGPKRFMAPALPVHQLPQTDIVLLSHTHYDHLDAASATAVGNRPLWIVPLGVSRSLAALGVTNVVELDWWQDCAMEIPRADGGGTVSLKVTLTPAKHWTARSPFDKNRELWGSFCVRSKLSGTSIYFGGDSAYCPSLFKRIGERHGPFDLALLPIGAYKPRWFMKDVHCSPEEAVQIHTDLGAKQSLGIHWGTFHLADEVEPPIYSPHTKHRACISTLTLNLPPHPPSPHTLLPLPRPLRTTLSLHWISRALVLPQIWTPKMCSQYDMETRCSSVLTRRRGTSVCVTRSWWTHTRPTTHPRSRPTARTYSRPLKRRLQKFTPGSFYTSVNKICLHQSYTSINITLNFCILS